METMGLQDTRQRAVSLIEEAGTLLGMIPKLLDDNDSLRADVEAAGRECWSAQGRDRGAERRSPAASERSARTSPRS